MANLILESIIRIFELPLIGFKIAAILTAGIFVLAQQQQS